MKLLKSKLLIENIFYNTSINPLSRGLKRVVLLKTNCYTESDYWWDKSFTKHLDTNNLIRRFFMTKTISIRCDVCGGAGRMPCYECKGSGNCTHCHGSGCDWCHGRGVCGNCQGSTIIVCTTCDGTGYLSDDD